MQSTQESELETVETNRNIARDVVGPQPVPVREAIADGLRGPEAPTFGLTSDDTGKLATTRSLEELRRAACAVNRLPMGRGLSRHAMIDHTAFGHDAV